MLLEITGLKVNYDGAEALRGISMKVMEGAVVCLLGSNGAGKTTLLRTISGLKRSAAGEINLLAQKIDTKAPEEIVKMGVVHCPEGRKLYSEMTVLENLMMGAYLRKDKEGVKKDLEMIAQRFPILKKRIKQQAGTLSGGEQQMLAIARALMAKPRLLLLDEPSTGLSPIMINEVAHIITDIHQSGVSVLLVEQNSKMALNVAEYAYVLEEGNISLYGPAEQIAQNKHVKKAYLGI